MDYEERQRRLEKFKKKRYRWVCYLLSIVFVFVIFGFSIVSLIKPDKKTSEQENRNLQQFPSMTLTGIKDKTWMDDLEDYTADQFVLRDAWVSLKTTCDRLQGKKEFNGNYLGDDGYLMQIPTDPDEKQEALIEDNVNAMNDFAERYSEVNTSVLIAPNAVWTLSDKLPSGAPVRDQEEDSAWIEGMLSANINYIDAFTALKEHKSEALYYKTDHHWTTLGAKYAYLAAADALEIEATDKFDEYVVTADFQGTLSSNSGYHGQKDTIEVFAPRDSDVSYLVTDSDDQSKRATLYDLDALDTKNKYEVFFGGNHSLVDIVTNSESDKVLVVFKDSYANSFVPFLIPYYSEIIMVDPRYYYDNIDTLMDSHGVTDVLFLYNMDTFLGDNSIADVLAATADTTETTDDAEAVDLEDTDATETDGTSENTVDVNDTAATTEGEAAVTTDKAVTE